MLSRGDTDLGAAGPSPGQIPALTMFASSLQMADAMEMMILSILAPQLHCEWRLPSWQVALLTSVGSPAALSCRALARSGRPLGPSVGRLPLLLLPRARQERIKPWLETMGPQLPLRRCAPHISRRFAANAASPWGPMTWGPRSSAQLPGSWNPPAHKPHNLT